MLYFAYGSNLSIKQMKRRCPDSIFLEKGYLRDYRLTFTRYSSGWKSGVADIVFETGSFVWGFVYQITEEDLLKLDKYEGYSEAYYRIQVTINSDVKVFENVWVYFVINKSEFIPPAERYLKIIKKAAFDMEFPEEYISYINSFIFQKDC